MITRRSFLATACAGAAASLVLQRRAGADSPFDYYIDPFTGATVHKLTTDETQDQVVYQTHPQWSKDRSRLLYRSHRDGLWAPIVLDMATGERRVLVHGPDAEFLDIENNRLLFIQRRSIHAAPFTLDEGETQTVGSLPDEVVGLAGGMFLDASEPIVYVGVVKEADARWALMACSMEDGSWRTVCDLDFQIGHVQANPTKSGEVMFCHETGGDAPQRMWMVDESGEPRPAYKETYDEWVTHEVWWGSDDAVFTIWPYDEKRLASPHGIVSVNVRDGKVTHHSQYRAWHTHGSEDKQWIVGDDFDRNLWLIRVSDGDRRLLTQGHNSEGFNTHPHMSFTPDGKSIVFGSSRTGSHSVFLVDLPKDFTSLPKS